jgi:hypothetical protein
MIMGLMHMTLSEFHIIIRNWVRTEFYFPERLAVSECNSVPFQIESESREIAHDNFIPEFAFLVSDEEKNLPRLSTRVLLFRV